MTVRYTAVKGVEDILPPETALWHGVEAVAREVFSLYGYHELRIPVMEFTDIFERSIGETTDIVEKEMYTFSDKAGRSITLRPEGTAPVVRCYVERHLHTLPSPQKFFYSGPMFRYERPQKGRQRQFYQIGVESFGVEGPGMDAEVLSMLRLFLDRVGLKGYSLELNSTGCELCRPLYRESLIGFFSGRVGSLCPDCERRYGLNPLRILDCKVAQCIALRKGAPAISDHLCPVCKGHLDELMSLLGMLDIPYRINPEMVRGLDYYTRTAFEITFGGQKAVAAGGRYDRLVEKFGGPPTPAIGFAIGMERLIALIRGDKVITALPHIFIASLGRDADKEALRLAEKLRTEGLRVETSYGGASLKSQMRRADRLGAGYLLIIGDDELREGRAKWKNLKDGSSGEVAIADAVGFLKTKAGNKL